LRSLPDSLKIPATDAGEDKDLIPQRSAVMAKKEKRSDPISAEGAEAKVGDDTFLGLSVVRKTRIPKSYRPQEMDQRVRMERLKTEVRNLREARNLGVRTPLVLDLNLSGGGEFVMEKLDGRTLTDMIMDPATPMSLVLEALEKLGEALGKLHAGNLAHGDLTASNVIWTEGDVALIDPSMGTRASELEDLGIDLHLVEEDLNTLSKHSTKFYEQFLEGYRKGNPSAAKRVIERAQEIKKRVRYS
jgi:Kae1-associated kinase Bud32